MSPTALDVMRKPDKLKVEEANDSSRTLSSSCNQASSSIGLT
jgi:hypothetical protein